MGHDVEFGTLSAPSAHSPADTAGICKILPWDSQFWGVTTARIQGQRLVAASAIAVDQWCRDHEVQFVYLLADANDIETARVAEDFHYRMVDIRMTLSCHLASPSVATEDAALDGVEIRESRAEDVPALVQIARVSYADTRFYADANLARTRCDDLYETWIRRSCEDEAIRVLVTAVAGEAVGYATCHLDDTAGRAVGSIGLLGVSPRMRGRGLGRAMVDQALRWFIAQGVESVSVITQGRNVVALRLYQRAGFLTHRVQVWYHKWYLPKEGRNG